MGFLSNLFKPHASPDFPLKWDMHNHVLFGLDDGAKEAEQSLQMLRKFCDLGYSYLIATPHVMSDYYPNTRAGISAVKQNLETLINDNKLSISLDFAAEYYMDEVFYDAVKNKEDILTFHGNHVLVETSFMNKPVFFEQLLFEIRTAGYQPVLAHPERYIYLQENYQELEKLMQSGIKLQINLMSLKSYYSPMAKKLAAWLIKNEYYHFLGTDAHSFEHLQVVEEVFKTSLFSQINFDRVENAHPFKAA